MLTVAPAVRLGKSHVVSSAKLRVPTGPMSRDTALPAPPLAAGAAAALRAPLAERDAVLAERCAELHNATLAIEKLKVQCATLRWDRYGKLSENLATEIGQLELLIGDAEKGHAQATAAGETKARTKGPHGNRRRPALREPLPEHLPRDTILHEPVFARRCGCTEGGRIYGPRLGARCGGAPRRGARQPSLRAVPHRAAGGATVASRLVRSDLRRGPHR